MRLKMSGNGRLPKFVVHNVKPKSQFPNDGKIQKIATLVPAIVQFVSDDRNFQWYFGKTPKPHAGSPKNLARPNAGRVSICATSGADFNSPFKAQEINIFLQMP